MENNTDEFWMRRALRLAVLGRHASPNPMVGCVIVDRFGNKLGEGFHPAPGQPHAEVFAVAKAGHSARGATAYVTLEPCSHHGRTPPCADLLVEAGISRVVIAMSDPDSRVSGNGIGCLLAAGIEVDLGVMETEARLLNRAYIHHRTTGMPWVTVKVATTLDGKMATVDGDSRWITGPVTRRWVHRGLRDRADAILVGVNTVLVDNPSLTTRLSQRIGRDPLRIIVDSRLRTPLDSKVVKHSEVDGKTVIACLAQFAQDGINKYAGRGVVVLPVDADNDSRVDLRKLLHALGTSYAVSAVLVEGGASIIASAVERRLVNRYVTTIGPKLVGGNLASGPIGGNGLASRMKEAPGVFVLNVRRSAVDIVIDASIGSD